MKVHLDIISKVHEQTVDCVQRMEKRWQHAAVIASQKALSQRFTIYGKDLEQVKAFRYL